MRRFSKDGRRSMATHCSASLSFTSSASRRHSRVVPFHRARPSPPVVMRAASLTPTTSPTQHLGGRHHRRTAVARGGACGGSGALWCEDLLCAAPGPAGPPEGERRARGRRRQRPMARGSATQRWDSQRASGGRAAGAEAAELHGQGDGFEETVECNFYPNLTTFS